MQALTFTTFATIALGFLSMTEGSALPGFPVLAFPPNLRQPLPPRQPITLPQLPPPPPPQPCSVKGSFQLGDKCILVEQSTLRWFQARRYCRQLGYKLAEITSGSYYFYLIAALGQRGLSYKSYWIGAARSGATRKWSWITSYSQIHPTFWAVTIIDGKGVKEPRNDYYRNCGLLDVTRSHFINTDYCRASHGFICEGDVNQAPVTRTYNYFSDAEEEDEESYGTNLECEDGWTQWADGQKCYKIVEENNSFSYARAKCEAQNSTLVTITSAEENAVVAGIIANSSSSLWIGLSKTPPGPFKWTTYEKFDYKNWAAGEPDLKTYKSDVCGEISPEGGKWSDDLCAVQKGFICEMEAEDKTYFYYYGNNQ